MALYEGFDMTFVKMPKYLPTNKYQNKDPTAALLQFASYYNSIKASLQK